MRLRFLLFLLISVSTACASPAKLKTAIVYTLKFPEALNHYVEVQADIPTDGADELELFMPTWTPGSYLIREYSRNIDRIDASTIKDEPIEIVKTAKNRWKVACPGFDTVRVTYRLYGWEINVRSNWIEGDFAMINAAPTYLTVVDNYQRPYNVVVELPEGWAGTCSTAARTTTPSTGATRSP